MTVRVHPFPFRTRQLSSLVLTILAWRRAGKISQRQHKAKQISLLRFFVSTNKHKAAARVFHLAAALLQITLKYLNGLLSNRCIQPAIKSLKPLHIMIYIKTFFLENALQLTYKSSTVVWCCLNMLFVKQRCMR